MRESCKKMVVRWLVKVSMWSRNSLAVPAKLGGCVGPQRCCSYHLCDHGFVWLDFIQFYPVGTVITIFNLRFSENFSLGIFEVHGHDSIPGSFSLSLALAWRSPRRLRFLFFFLHGLRTNAVPFPFSLSLFTFTVKLINKQVVLQKYWWRPRSYNTQWP